MSHCKSARPRKIGRFCEPRATPTWRGSLTSRMQGKTSETPPEANPMRKQTGPSQAPGTGARGRATSAQAATYSAVAAIIGGRRSPSQRSDTQPKSGAPMRSPTAVSMRTLEAATRRMP